jgi:hypothetical protein
MSPLSLVLLVAGAALIVVGARRFMPPYRRYQALQEQDANVARYEAWRGGARPDAKTGASVAMAVLRRQLQMSGLIVIAGFVCVAVAFVLR